MNSGIWKGVRINYSDYRNYRKKDMKKRRIDMEW
jgi:hypothetical protein